MQTGEADVSLSIPVANLSALEADPGVEVLKAESPRTATLYMNNGRAPFDDVDFRRAVRSALDLDALAGSVYEGAALPSTGPFASSEPWAGEEAETPQQDVAAAKELLASAGYTAERPLEIIAIVERAEFADVATVIQENLESVGVPVTITTKEYAAVEPDLLSGDYDMVLSQRNRLIDIADPIGFLTADYTCEGSYNLSHFCDEDYDALIAEGLAPIRRWGEPADIGAIVSGLLMVAVGFSAGPEQGVWAIVVYFLVQNIDGYLVLPYIARRTVDLAPAVLLAAQLIFGALFGFLGILLADSILASIKVALQEVSKLKAQEGAEEPDTG